MDDEMMKSMLFDAIKSQSEDTDGMFITSFKQANELLQMHMVPATFENARYRKELVGYVTNEENNVRADCNVIHNFVMDLFRVGDFVLALDVCDFALKFAPHNRDILGDAIKACGDGSMFDRGEQYLAAAFEIPTEYWSYRLFLYSVDFLKEKFDADPDNMDIFNQAMNLAEKYIEVFPLDEHGYNQKAELLVAANRREEAISFLRTTIQELKPDKDDKNSVLVCAQCCITMLNLLDDSNDYKYIAEIADIGMKHTTQEQPSAAIGFFMYRKALAWDALAHSDDFRKETVNTALGCYQAAYDLNQGRSYAHTIEQRYALLRPHAEDWKPLEKRKFFTEDQDEE